MPSDTKAGYSLQNNYYNYELCSSVSIEVQINTTVVVFVIKDINIKVYVNISDPPTITITTSSGFEALSRQFYRVFNYLKVK